MGFFCSFPLLHPHSSINQWGNCLHTISWETMWLLTVLLCWTVTSHLFTCFRHDSAVIAPLLCLYCPQWVGSRLNIYHIVSEDSHLKCAPPLPLGKGGWTQNVCVSTGAWARITVRAGLTKSLSRNSKGFPVQLPEWVFSLVGWGFLFCLFICLEFGLVLSFWWLKANASVACSATVLVVWPREVAALPLMALLTKG